MLQIASGISTYYKIMKDSVESEKKHLLYPGALLAATSFSKPYPRTSDYGLLTMAFLYLLEKYMAHIRRSKATYIKCTLGYGILLADSTAFSYTRYSTPGFKGG